MESKYYFVFVRTDWTYYKSDKIPIKADDNEFQHITDVHPLEWQIEYNREHSMMPIKDGGTYKYVTQRMTVISWQPLTLEEYKEFEGKI